MVSIPMPNIKRGRMSIDEKKQIDAIAASMKKPTPSKIAVRLNRHPATVNWYMITKGLIERKPGYAPGPYQRGGKMVYPYSPDHDRFILDRRSQGMSKREIAALLTAEFGFERSQHSVDVRLVQLAAAPEGNECGG